MKIFIGTYNICDAPWTLKKGFEELGHEADVACLTQNIFYKDKVFCCDIKQIHESTKIHVQPDGSVRVVEVSPQFRTISNKYDIFIFWASHSLLPRMLDLPILKTLGKRIACYHSGSDIRHEITANAFWGGYGHAFPRMAYPTSLNLQWWKMRAFEHNLLNKCYNIRMSERYATTILTSPAAGNLNLRPYMHSVLPFDSAVCSFSLPKNKIPVVVHAPSNHLFKRSSVILETLQELAEEGIPFKIRFLEHVPNEKVLEELTNADILIDQISCASTARLALEGMASGCAVLSGNSAAIPWPPDRPALSVTPLSFKEKLRKVLTDMPLRIELALKGRDYIDKNYHSPASAAQNILSALEKEKQGQFDYYPTIFSEIATCAFEGHMPLFLQTMTLEILKKHGTSPMTDLIRLEREGFLAPQSAHQDVSRWDMSKLHKIGPWNWCGKHIPVPNFDTEHTFNN